MLWRVLRTDTENHITISFYHSSFNQTGTQSAPPQLIYPGMRTGTETKEKKQYGENFALTHFTKPFCHSSCKQTGTVNPSPAEFQGQVNASKLDVLLPAVQCQSSSCKYS